MNIESSFGLYVILFPLFILLLCHVFLPLISAFFFWKNYKKAKMRIASVDALAKMRSRIYWQQAFITAGWLFTLVYSYSQRNS
jgi:hypothetical protein